MPSIPAATLYDRIEKTGVVAVLVVDRPEDAVPLAGALLDGGLDIAEVTLRTPASLEVIQAMKEVKDVVVGAGTVLTTEQLRQVVDAGAEFGVAPGINPRVLQAAKDAGLPFIPGVLTPSEIEQALEFGCRNLKLFPAEPSGGMSYLKSIAAPYAHLGVRFIPLGGLSLANVRPYFESSHVLAIGGSWIAKRELIEKRDWKAIAQNARDARALAKESRQKLQK